MSIQERFEAFHEDTADEYADVPGAGHPRGCREAGGRQWPPPCRLRRK
ncbi:hypothetical protein [Streptomyces sp. NPDC018059]